MNHIDLMWERVQSADSGQHKSIVPDAVRSAESLASADPKDSFQSQPHLEIKEGKTLIYHNGVRI